MVSFAWKLVQVSEGRQGERAVATETCSRAAVHGEPEPRPEPRRWLPESPRLLQRKHPPLAKRTPRGAREHASALEPDLAEPGFQPGSGTNGQREK